MLSVTPVPRIQVERRVEKLVRVYDLVRERGSVSAYAIGREWGSSPRHFYRWLRALARLGVIESHTRGRWRVVPRYTDRRRAIERIGECGGNAVIQRDGRYVAPDQITVSRARIAAGRILHPELLDGIEKYFDSEEDW